MHGNNSLDLFNIEVEKGKRDVIIIKEIRTIITKGNITQFNTLFNKNLLLVFFKKTVVRMVNIRFSEGEQMLRKIALVLSLTMLRQA